MKVGPPNMIRALAIIGCCGAREIIGRRVTDRHKTTKQKKHAAAERAAPATVSKSDAVLAYYLGKQPVLAANRARQQAPPKGDAYAVLAANRTAPCQEPEWTMREDAIASDLGPETFDPLARLQEAGVRELRRRFAGLPGLGVALCCA